MALVGTVRRIAYEHKLDLPERLIESALNEPAEVALWRDGSGRLKHFAIVMTRNTLSRAIQLVLPIVDDVQLKSAGTLQNTDVKILVLEYGYRHRLVLLAKGNRVVVLSDPGMLLAPKAEEETPAQSEDPPAQSEKPPAQSEAAAALIAGLLEGKTAFSPFAQRFQLNGPLSGKQHEVLIGARVFAFGYDAFMPGLAALNFTFDPKGKWQSAVLLDKTALPAQANERLWSALPHGASLCAALPVDWSRFAPLLKNLNEMSETSVVPETFAEQFTGAAAVCWYKDARFYTPLFVTRLKSSLKNEAHAKEFFSLLDATTNTASVNVTYSADINTKRGLWEGNTPSLLGAPDDDGQRSLKPTLAVHQDIVLFSPDAALVKNALDVAEKRYPALRDSFDDTTDANAFAFIDPAALSALLRKEIFAALPRDEETSFHNAANVYLSPRLDALAAYPAQRVRVAAAQPQKGAPNPLREWRALVWTNTRSAP
jgi:uncharacterized protein YfaA (DUF2138 family)